MLVDIGLGDDDDEEEVDVDDEEEDECVMGLDVDWMKCTSDANKQLLVM